MLGILSITVFFVKCMQPPIRPIYLLHLNRSQICQYWNTNKVRATFMYQDWLFGLTRRMIRGWIHAGGTPLQEAQSLQGHAVKRCARLLITSNGNARCFDISWASGKQNYGAEIFLAPSHHAHVTTAYLSAHVFHVLVIAMHIEFDARHSVRPQVYNVKTTVRSISHADST